jgi:hypothetical protein
MEELSSVSLLESDLRLIIDVADLLDDEPEVVVPGQRLVHQVKILTKKIYSSKIMPKILPFGTSGLEAKTLVH